MDTIQRIKQANDLRADKTLEAKRHFEAQDANKELQEIILKSFRSLVAYLDNPSRITKATVVNQLKSIGTPDALKVENAVKELHATVKTHKNTDLSEVANLLKGVLAEMKQVPKSHKDINIPAPIDNSKQLTSLEAAIKAVNETLKKQELKVEAPIVNVPETKVDVQAPDLSSIETEQRKTRQELVKAVKGIIIPSPDLKPTEKELKKLNKLFNEFLDSVPAGGGGGGGVVSYVNTNGVAQPVTLQANGSIPTTITNPGDISGGGSAPFADYASARQDLSSDPMYFGYENADGDWYIKQFGITSTETKYYEGTGGISTGWAGRAGYTYVDYNAL